MPAPRDVPDALHVELLAARPRPGLLLGGVPRRLLRADPPALDDLAGGAPAAAHPHLARALLEAGLARARPARSTWGPADVTAVVPVRDDAARLPAALAALAGLAEVVVVDDGSRDGTGDVARRLGARVLRTEVPQGPAAARNRGLRAARTPLVVLLDADARAEPGWVEGLLPALADPAVLLVAPRVLGLQDRGGPLLERYERAMGVLDRGPVPAAVGPGREVGFVAAAALLVRREPLLALGGFAEELRLGEDVDLCARAARQGWTLRYEPSVVVRHEHRTRWRAFLRRRVQYGSAAPVLAARHGALEPPASLTGWAAAACLVLGAPRPAAVAAAGLLGAAGAARTSALLLAEGLGTRQAVRTALRDEVDGARRLLGTTVRHPGLPLVAALALRHRRARTVLGLAAAGLHLREHRARRPELGAGTFVALRLLDELALGAGLWSASARHRTLRALVPAVALLPRRGGRSGPGWQERLVWAAPRR